jgi:hypothetical protein
MENCITLWSEWETSSLTFQLVTHVGSLDIVTSMIDLPIWEQNVGTVPVLNTNMLLGIIPCSTLAVLFEWDLVSFHMELWVFMSCTASAVTLASSAVFSPALAAAFSRPLILWAAPSPSLLFFSFRVPIAMVSSPFNRSMAISHSALALNTRMVRSLSLVVDGCLGWKLFLQHFLGHRPDLVGSGPEVFVH